MIYQRHMPREELVAAQLEMLLQNGRLAAVSVHLIGVVATIVMFWPYMQLSTLLLWAAGFLIFLLLRSLHMSNALVERRQITHPLRLYWQLLSGAAVTGAAWSLGYIYALSVIPSTMQEVFLLMIVMVAAFSLGFSVAIREYYLVYIFASLWPIAWWTLVHFLDRPYNAVIGFSLLAFIALLIYVCDQTYKSLRNMISLTWEREHTAQELGDLTVSLRERNRQLRDARRQLTELANVDELTGLGNRRLANNVLQEEINRARRAGSELSVVLLDVDYFKAYNDTYGHPEGDGVLQKLADIMQRTSTRAGEVVARYGGEEFILILPGTSSEAAVRTATRLKEMVVEESIPHEGSKTAGVVTVSQGIVTVRPDGQQQPSDLVKAADQALYRAKDAGRNTIQVHDSQP
jgi:diguanylate cyclase (GGDEF)-like protein